VNKSVGINSTSQRRIGLTGGIATGKTTVSNYLAQHHHLPILDADRYAREAVLPGSEILAAIHQRYGDDILRNDGSLDRAKLGQIIFTHSDERLWLESHIHPFVRSKFQEELATPELQRLPIVILDIPLLFEAQSTTFVTEIWVVTCSESQQLQRLIQRNGLSPAAAQARINSQWPLAQKAAAADVVLDNSSTIEALYQAIDVALGKNHLFYV
jgi:dephospho-CoA kinase